MSCRLYSSNLSITMKNISITEHVIGIPVGSIRRLRSSEQLDSKDLHTSLLSNGSSLTDQMRLRPKITEMLKIKLSFGQKILQLGGATKVFKLNFSVVEGEKLVKAFQCCLSTTVGPMPGLLFITTNKVSFCSEQSVKISSPTGEAIKVRYKISIPLVQIKKARESKDVNIASKKYLEIVTIDNFDFWFMGFRNHQRTFKYLEQAISQAHQ